MSEQQPNGLFDWYEKQYGKEFADQMRSGCRTWFIIFGIAITVIAIAGWSIWNSLSG